MTKNNQSSKFLPSLGSSLRGKGKEDIILFVQPSMLPHMFI